MPEFEPLDTDERPVVAGPESELPGLPGRRWPWQLGMIGLLLAAGTMVILQRSPDSDQPSRTPTAPASPKPTVTQPPLPTVESPTRLVLRPVTLDLPGVVSRFDVAPDGYAVVVSDECPGLPKCRAALATSRDGEHWTRRRLPPGLADGPDVRSLGAGVLVIDQLPDRRWRSRDGGRTWRQVPVTAAPAAPDASSGALVVTDRLGSGALSCSGRHLAVVRRDDGRTAPLRHPPSGIRPCQALPYPDMTGRMWVGGVARVSDRPQVAVSYDTGATWRTWSLPGFRGDADQVWLSVAGTDVYAIVFGPIHESAESFGVLAIFWYDGHRWRQTSRYEGPAREVNRVIACPNGMLLAVQQLLELGDRQHQMVSFDRGHTWAVTDGPVLITNTTPPNALPDLAYYGRSYLPRGLQGLARSTDCRTWRTLGVR